MSNVNFVGVRLQVLVLHRHGANGRVVAGIPRARDSEDKSAASGAVGTRLAVSCTSITGGGSGRSGTNGVSDLGVVVGHEVDLNGTCGRVGPVNGDLLTWFPVDGALVEIAGRVVDDERRVGILVLPCLEAHRGSSSKSRSGEDGCNSQGFCERSHCRKLFAGRRVERKECDG